MPLNFIPNQPIIFADPIGDYPCLNNDEKVYAQLLQNGDEMCIQWQLVECGNTMCEPNMVMPTPGSDLLGVWTTGMFFPGWSSTGSDNVQFVGTNAISSYTETVNSFTTIDGAVYRLKFTVDYLTGNSNFNFKLYPTTGTVSETDLITTSGDYEFYFVSDDINSKLRIEFEPPLTVRTPSDTLSVSNIELIQWTDCWIDAFDPGVSWSYEFDGTNGTFCSVLEDGDLVNTNAFTTTGNYHSVSFTISDCTAGGLEVRLGSVLLGTTSGNGVFNYAGTPTAGTDLVFTKVNGFNGCVSLVSVKDFGDISNVNVTLRALDNSMTGTGITANTYDDRLVACFKPEDLTWAPRQPRDCELLQVDVTEPCSLTIYTSVNQIQYIKDGIPCTKLVESWNDGYAFGFYFGDVNNPDFVLRQRLRVLAFNPVYRNAGEEYLYSSGNTGRSFAQSQKARTAWFDYMDEYAHDCTRTQLLGQKLLIDNYAFYYPTEDYEPEWNERGAYNLAQSRVTVFHEEAIFGSTCGTLPNAVCPPQLVPTPTPCESTTLGFKNDYQSGSIDWSDIYTSTVFFFTNGSALGLGLGAYDLTTIAGRSALYLSLVTVLSNEFGVTATGTVDLVGTTLSIDISGSYITSYPTNYITVSFRDSAGVHFAISSIAS